MAKNRINTRGRIARDGFSWPQQGYWPLLYAHLYSEDGDVAPGSRKAEMLRLMLVGYMHENGLVEDEPARRFISHRRISADHGVRQNVSHSNASPDDPHNEDRPDSGENDGKRRKVSGSAEHHPTELVRPDRPNGESDPKGSSSNGESRTKRSQLSTKSLSTSSGEINGFSDKKNGSSQSSSNQRNDDTTTHDQNTDTKTNKPDEVISERDIVDEDKTPSHTSTDNVTDNGGKLGAFDPSNYCA